MRQIAAFNLSTFHSQICVYDPDLEDTFNDWLQQHFDQGFTWRPYSVSFRSVGADDDCDVEVWQAETINVATNAIRAIQVPFLVPTSGLVVISNVYSSVQHEIHLPTREYILIFEYGFRDEYWNNPEYQANDAAFIPTWCRFTFIPAEAVQPEILRADSELSPTYPLLMEAEPA